MRVRMLMILAMLLASGPMWADQCLYVERQRVDVEEPGPLDTVSLAVNWEVELENRCDARFTADLTIRFLDDSDAAVYEVRSHATLELRERTTTGQRVFVPRRHADEIKSISVHVDERELEL
ncbi:MAG TPA: hypothetical protein PL143_07260 [Rhodocyclaceae bacterium]|nr:hypothetical protein [Rhodocyclaceae bacterium]